LSPDQVLDIEYYIAAPALKVFIAGVTSFITRFLFQRTVKSVLYR